MKLFRHTGIAALFLAAWTAADDVLPVDLPPPDATPPAAGKPVKIYIKVHPGYGEALAADGTIKKPGPDDWHAGKPYDDYTTAIRVVLDNFGERYPQINDQGHEVAGFVWMESAKLSPFAEIVEALKP